MRSLYWLHLHDSMMSSAALRCCLQPGAFRDGASDKPGSQVQASFRMKRWSGLRSKSSSVGSSNGRPTIAN